MVPRLGRDVQEEQAAVVPVESIVVETTRVCNTCEQSKLNDEFGEYTTSGGKRVRRRKCNSCRRDFETRRYETNPEVRERVKQRARGGDARLSMDSRLKMWKG